MQLADPNFNEPGAVLGLLGAAIFFEPLLEDQMKAAREGPILQNSKMGWIVAGALNTTTRVRHVAQSSEVAQGSDIIERFWAIEESERSANQLSIAQQTNYDSQNSHDSSTAPRERREFKQLLGPA